MEPSAAAKRFHSIGPSKEKPKYNKTRSLEMKIDGLRPFSDYFVKIEGEGAEGRRVKPSASNFSTTVSDPAARPEKPLSKTNSVEVTEIKYTWSKFNDCKAWNGKPRGYRVEHWGVDHWVSGSEPLTVNSVHVDQPYYVVEKLLPYTTYLLKVFLVNEEGRYNPELPLLIRERTRPTIPDPPENITAYPVSSNMIRIQMEPVFPATGRISEIFVYLISDDGLESQRNYSQNESRCNHGSICLDVNGLTPDTAYVVQVQIMHENVPTTSFFSRNVMARTQRADNQQYVSTTTPVTMGQLSSDGNPKRPPRVHSLDERMEYFEIVLNDMKNVLNELKESIDSFNYKIWSICMVAVGIVAVLVMIACCYKAF